MSLKHRIPGLSQRSVLASLLFLILALALGACATRSDRKRAVIVDQLSLTLPNRAFVDRASELLEQAGYSVDYYPGEMVSVGLFSGLPAQDYDLIVLRAHSARIESAQGQTDDVALFTGEVIDLERYDVLGVPDPAATAVAEMVAAQHAASDDPIETHSPDLVRDLIPVFYDPESGELPYFGLRPSFIEHHLQGRFDGSPTLIMMGCDGLRSNTLARAFVSQGVASFVSWTAPVSAPHTDAATERLLELILQDGLTVPAAVRQTATELGPDPSFGGELTHFPGS